MRVLQHPATDILNGGTAWRIICLQPLNQSVQARRHRKRRIDKKWRKRYGYTWAPLYLFEPDTVMRIGDVWYAYEPTYSLLIKMLEENKRELLTPRPPLDDHQIDAWRYLASRPKPIALPPPDPLEVFWDLVGGIWRPRERT